MSQPWTGIGTRFALSLPESGYGTEAARARTLRTKSVGVASKTTTTVVEDTSSYNYGATERVVIDQEVMGPIEANLAYQGNALGLLLKAIFGSLSEGGGAGPTYTHTYTPGALSSFSAEEPRGDSGTSEEFYGLYASKAVITIPARGPATITIDWIGESAGARASTGTIPAMSTSAVYVLGHQCTGWVFNSTTYQTNKIVITIDNKMTGRKDHGSIYIGEAGRDNRVEVMLDVELDQRANTIKAAALAGTSAAWSVTCSDGTRSLVFSGSAGFVETHDDAIGSSKVIAEKLRMRALAVEGSADIVSVVLTNADNTYEDS